MNIFPSIFAEAHGQATTSTVDMQSKDQPLACTASVAGRPTTSAARHSASTNQSPSELVQRKPQLDIDSELDDGSIIPSSSEDSEPVRKKPRLDIDSELDDGSIIPSSSEDSEPYK